MLEWNKNYFRFLHRVQNIMNIFTTFAVYCEWYDEIVVYREMCVIQFFFRFLYIQLFKHVRLIECLSKGEKSANVFHFITVRWYFFSHSKPFNGNYIKSPRAHIIHFRLVDFDANVFQFILFTVLNCQYETASLIYDRVKKGKFLSKPNSIFIRMEWKNDATTARCATLHTVIYCYFRFQRASYFSSDLTVYWPQWHTFISLSIPLLHRKHRKMGILFDDVDLVAPKIVLQPLTFQAVNRPK